MATVAEAHITAQARLQQLAVAGVGRAWDQLSDHHADQVAVFLAFVVPWILAAQRQSAALTTAFIAQAIGRPPAGIDVTRVIGAAIRSSTPIVADAAAPAPVPSVALPAPTASAAPLPAALRGGVPPEVVYRRPFVTVWTKLAENRPLPVAIAAGRAQAVGSAALDVQNTMRHTLVAVGEANPTIVGYRRVPNVDACPLCKLVSGRRYLTGVLMEIHVHCKCGVEVITAANRGDFFGKDDNDLAIAPGNEVIRIVKHPDTPDAPAPAIALHGELGPLLVDGHDHFTGPDALAA